MPDHQRGTSARHRRQAGSVAVRTVVALVIVAAAAIISAVVLGRAGSDDARPVPAAGAALGSSGGPGKSSGRSDGRSLQAPVDATGTAGRPGVPVRVDVPSVGITSSLRRIGLDPKGRLRAPDDFTHAAWFAAGTRPGDVGPAVIAGHVDSRSGPAIFFRLRRVSVGDEIRVRDAAGVTRRFTVTDVHRYAKDKFPTDAVYGPTSRPVLRLVTCTGTFDARHRNYLDNLVVSASLQSPRAG